MFSKGGMSDLMKKAQEMQTKMKEVQAEIATTEVVGESGAGLVKITMLGNYSVIRVDIDDSLLGALDDKNVSEDLVAAAINDAVRRVEKINKDKMSGMTGGMNLPDGFKMPF